jgi:hypothetical protein
MTIYPRRDNDPTEKHEPVPHELVVVFPDGISHPKEAREVIHTGLRVMVHGPEAWVILPFRDEISAEECARIICGMLKS